MDARSTIAIVLLGLSIVFLGYVPAQEDFTFIISGFSVAFASYLWLATRAEISTSRIVCMAILLRFVLIFSIPQLSDDIYRFIWDGRMIHAGLDPYAHLPSEVVGSHQLLSHDLFRLLNSPDYYTIYTPLNQLLNYICTIVPSHSFWLESTIYKSILFLFELVGIYYLYKFITAKSWETKVLTLYLLNPLLIIEVMANCHFEGVMLSMIIMMLYYLSERKYAMAGIGYGLAIGAKLLPLMFGPYFLFKIIRGPWKSSFLLTAGVISIVGLSPILISAYLSGGHIVNSFDLYVSSFEFNASIYYVLRQLGFLLVGINMIHILGPALSLITLGAIVYVSWQYAKDNNRPIAPVMLIIYMIFILLSRTVHPWYLLLPLLLGVISHIRYPIIWTYLICWTYINYSYNPYHENMLIVMIEYGILAMLIYTTYQKDKSQLLR